MDRAVSAPSDGSSPLARQVAANLERVRARIAAAGGEPDRITICAVTKGQPQAAVEAALACGLVDLGENYAQELVAKAGAPSLASVPVRWHAIGRLQRNKVAALAPHVALWQTLDRPQLAEAIARRAPGAAVLVQVDATGEPGKGGCAPADAPALVEDALGRGLEVRGLMSVGPTDASIDPRRGFEQVRALAADLGLAELSMGMSRDLEQAVAAGATIVRPGTALFGARHDRPRSAK